jgi:hypothetical protein
LIFIFFGGLPGDETTATESGKGTLVPESFESGSQEPHHWPRILVRRFSCLPAFLIKFESGNEEAIFPEKKCFLRS